jgi:hypothetical protein
MEKSRIFVVVGSLVYRLAIIRFGTITSVSIQKQLEDGAGNLSDPLTINVPKPPGGV